MCITKWNPSGFPIRILEAKFPLEPLGVDRGFLVGDTARGFLGFVGGNLKAINFILEKTAFASEEA